MKPNGSSTDRLPFRTLKFGAYQRQVMPAKVKQLVNGWSPSTRWELRRAI